MQPSDRRFCSVLPKLKLTLIYVVENKAFRSAKSALSRSVKSTFRKLTEIH